VNDGSFVALSGRLDVHAAADIRLELADAVDRGHGELVIDLNDLEAVDATGLGVLVGGLKKVRAHDGSLQLICNQDRLLKIFRITGLAKVFTIHASADAALA
jgi:anti-sigma B factor antagonist